MTARQPLARILAAAAAFLPLAAAQADSWPQWRGPNGNGTASATAAPLPNDLSDEDIAWKTRLPGTGSATPSVWGERIFVTCPAPRWFTRARTGPSCPARSRTRNSAS